MEGSRRRDSSSSPVLPDLTQGYENELSPSDLDLNSYSYLTVDDSKGRLYQIEDSSKDCGTECVTAWTNEKHDLYLDHLESSFIEQLHKSIGLHSWCLNGDSKSHYSSRKLVAKTQNSSENVMSQQQDDCLQKIDLKRSHHMFADDVVEFSDQNFGDEASEQMCSTKRSKTILSEF